MRAEPVDRATNAVLHPWLKQKLTAILEQCPAAPTTPTIDRRWADWDWHEDAHLLDERFPVVRVLLIWDNLKGHLTPEMVNWCRERGIAPLYTPLAGSWMNMAESLQRIIECRALQGQAPENVEALKSWFRCAVSGWNLAPTPFRWGGKRHARRDRAYARRHRVGGSGATTGVSIRRRYRSVTQHHHSSIINANGLGK